MMHMTFYWGKTATLLVDPWRTNSWVSYLLSLHALFLASVFYQFLENHRVRFNLLRRSKSTSSIGSPFLCGGATRHFPDRVAAAVLFGVNSAIGYLLMLAVMSFNGGVFVAVVVGLAVGYFTFRGVEEDVVARENPCACS